MKSWTIKTVWFVVFGALASCSKMSDQDRLKLLVPSAQSTVPVQGQVLVDGNPVKDIWVTLHPVGKTGESLLPKAQTDDEGNFKITSYINGDGAPPGEYKITVEWLTFRQFGSQWVGPNKLDGPNGNEKTTEYSVTVEDEPITLPPFEEKASSDASKKVLPSSNDYRREKGRR